MWLRSIEETPDIKLLCLYPCPPPHTHTRTAAQRLFVICFFSSLVTPSTSPLHSRHTGFLPSLKFVKCFSNGLWGRVPTYVTINIQTPVNPIFYEAVKGNQLIQPSWKSVMPLGKAATILWTDITQPSCKFIHFIWNVSVRVPHIGLWLTF